MIHDYYSYKKESYICRHCGWTGSGSEVDPGEMFNDGFELDCPKCHERFPGLILFLRLMDYIFMVIKYFLQTKLKNFLIGSKQTRKKNKEISTYYSTSGKVATL
jgi:hypothetical protein